MNCKKLKLHAQKNKLLFYKAISEEFNALQAKYKGATISALYRKFIYKKYFISRGTLYKIFNTDVEKELQEIEQQIKEIK